MINDTATRTNHVKIAQVLGNRCEILNRRWFQALKAEKNRQMGVRRHAWLIFQLSVVRPGWGLRIHSGSCDVIARVWMTNAIRVGTPARR
jgi:hypothetical protein